MSREEILNTPMVMLNLMIADVPKLNSKKKEKKSFKDDHELASWLGAEEL